MRISVGCALLLVYVYAGHAQAPEFTTPVAIRGATIVPQPGRSIENGTVLIRHGRIEAVGTNLTIPPDTLTIDGAGLWVYPGFMDAASHLGMPDRPFDAAELDRIGDVETDVVQGPPTAMQHANRRGMWPHHSPADHYRIDEKGLEAYRNAGFTSAHIVPRAAVLGGWSDVVHMRNAPLRRTTIADSVAQIAALRTPAAADGFGRGAYPISAMGAFALMRQTFLDADWYAASQRRNAARALRDPVLDAILAIRERQTPVLFEANAPDEVLHALDMAKELGVRPVILGGKEAWSVADVLAASKTPVIVSLDWPEKPVLTPKKSIQNENAVHTTESWTADWEDAFFEPLRVRRERIREWEELVNNAARLMDAGVLVAFTGRDGKGPDALMSKAKEAIELDLTAEQALAALTHHAAMILGVDHKVGRVAQGACANLTVLTKPFGEEGVRVRYVFVDGEQFTYALPGEKPKNDAKEDAESSDDAPENGEEAPDSEREEPAGKDSEEESPEDAYPWASEIEADRRPTLRTGGDLLLRNARVLTVTQGVLDRADVRIRRGRIVEIGPNLSAPRDTSVIDLTGYWVMPGIVDPHSHIAIRGVNEFSDSVTPEVRMSDVITHTDRGIWRALAGGVTTIHTMHGSANTIGGQNAIIKMKYGTSPKEMLVDVGPPIVKFALGENVTRANSRDARGTRFPMSRMGVEAVVRQAFNDAQQYQAEWERYDRERRRNRNVERPRRDIRLEALSDILNGDIWIHSHCYRADEILRLLAVAEDYGVRVAALQHVLEGYRVMPEMVRHGVGGSTFSDWWAFKLESYHAIPHNASMMLKHGIVSSLNSDDRAIMRHLNFEAAKSIRFGGLTADEALRLITINPAIQLGLDHEIGSIETGKSGDIAVFTGHPLDAFSHCVLTLIDGEVYFQHPSFRESAGPGSEWTPKPPNEPIAIARNHRNTYAIVGATVHPVSQPAIENGVVVIRDGAIVSVGAGTQVPAEATIIDAAGLHVYPGLINAATDLGLAEISRIPAVNDTADSADLQPELKAVSAVNPFSQHIDVTRCEGITTVAVLPAGGFISGQAGFIHLTGWSMPEMLRDDSLGLVMNLPSLPANLGSEGRGDRINAHRKRIEEIEAFFRAARHYNDVHRRAANQRGAAPVRNVRLEAMAPFLNGERPVYFRAESLKEILEAIRFAETFGLKPVIVGGREAWKCAQELKAKDVPVVVTSILNYPASEYERFDANYGNAGLLEQAGVRIAFGLNNDGNIFAKQMPANAGMAVAHGLSKDGAVRAMTLGAAEILGVAGRTGSLDSGKVADVIITTGHPAQPSTRTLAVFIEGVPVSLTSVHEEQYQKWTNRPDANLPPAPDHLIGPPAMRNVSRL